MEFSQDSAQLITGYFKGALAHIYTPRDSVGSEIPVFVRSHKQRLSVRGNQKADPLGTADTPKSFRKDVDSVCPEIE